MHDRRLGRLRPTLSRSRGQQGPRAGDPRYSHRLWAFDRLSARPTGIALPPWHELGADDFVPAASSSGSGENTSEVPAEETMGPLLVWALRMVDDFAQDILVGFADTQRLAEAGQDEPQHPGRPDGAGGPSGSFGRRPGTLPAVRLKGQQEEYGLARYYIGGITGASRHQVALYVARRGLVATAVQHPGPCPLPTPVTGRIAGRPWREALDFAETPGPIRLLVTAYFIVIAYLTRVRLGEVLGLRRGCCPDPEPDDSSRTGRHLIYGHEYKNATDDRGNHQSGNHQSGGRQRDIPWVAITPVVSGIRVLHFADARGLKVYAGSSPITRASGLKSAITRRWVKNDRLLSLGPSLTRGVHRGERPLLAPP
ncbi:hypothetical protein [Streptomyces sp. NPDC053069]|uniref:hypothetical protein n=1 Tax=Streptomyces sp. NPDC053069 TaxID=3365695 RepID=UPI0037D2AE76